MEQVGEILKQSDVGTPTTSSSSSSSTDSPKPKPKAPKPEAQTANSDSSCPVCGGTGYLREDVPVGHPRFGKLVPCQCTQQELENRRLVDMRAVSNLDALARYTFESFRPGPPLAELDLTDREHRSLRIAYDTARAFAEDPKGWLVLLGGYGCGKTHLAAAIANEQLTQGRPVLFVVVPDLLDHLRATYSPHSTVTYDRRFDQVRNAPLLILDDLGTQSSTEWAREKLFQIFNYRYNAGLPTVITTNLKLEAIDIRIRSRLVDPELVQICTMLVPDFRGSGVQQVAHELSTLSLHSDQTFETFSLRKKELTSEQTESLHQAYTFAVNYAKSPEDWMLLTGGYGCGKTHLAAAIANERVRQGHPPPLFVVVPDLLDHLRATYAPNSPVPYDKRLDEIRSASLLILDDLGTHSATPWAQEKLYQIFNYRYNARLPTVITAADDANIDERLKSRLFDRGRCINLRINAPSYRGSEARTRR